MCYLYDTSYASTGTVSSRPSLQAHLGCQLLQVAQDGCACLGQVALGKFESGNLAQSFMRMGDKSELLAKSAREQSAALSESFEAPLKVAFFHLSDPSFPSSGALSACSMSPCSWRVYRAGFMFGDSSMRRCLIWLHPRDHAGVCAAGEELQGDDGGPGAGAGVAADGARRRRRQALQAHEAARHARYPGAHNLTHICLRAHRSCNGVHVLQADSGFCT